MTAAKEPTAAAELLDTAGSADTVGPLLRRWVEHVNRDGDMGMAQPEWFAYVGELAVEDQLTWFGLTTMGGWYHSELPAGLDRAPVYAGFHWHEGDEGRVARVSMVVVPLADPDRIAAARWGEGYDGYEPAPVDGYAVLCSAPFDPVRVDDRDADADLREAARVIAAGDREGRRTNYAEIVSDPAACGNVMFFPVAAEERGGYEATEADGTVVCLAFTAYDFT